MSSPAADRVVHGGPSKKESLGLRRKPWSSGTSPTQRSRKKQAGEFQARIKERGGVAKDEDKGEQCWITHNSGA